MAMRQSVDFALFKRAIRVVRRFEAGTVTRVAAARRAA